MLFTDWGGGGKYGGPHGTIDSDQHRFGLELIRNDLLGGSSGIGRSI
ncbi:hypothetical protein [Stieleria neptunia]|nr:hypothetical protein [Stieleria neptunia]